MQNQLGFVFKVFFFSALLSVLIKYAPGSPLIPATVTNALIIVFLPSVIMAGLLLWKQKQN
ncbi:MULTISPECIES: hypothetical protein [Nostocales]|uniref:Uncharacterized protein n=3 Tax=Nostocales TaxID=1161 RepID=A0A0C1N0P9_9CYAN|nr:hypothetical protein [Tolypothrix bouteillei]KAF3891210.1 hypothetical protein DA73_0400030355 [Tolypothrix bouteillei VB521301]